MLVKNWMSRKLVTVDENDGMDTAIHLLRKHRIRMLPVLSRGKLTGVVTDGDLKRASASDATTLDVHELLYLISKIKVKQVMTKNPVTIPVDFTIEETAELMLEKKISSLPVVDGRGDLAGVVTESDIYRVLISLTGVGKRGIQFGLKLEDRPGSIKEAADVLRGYDARILSILTTYENVAEGYRKVYIRVFDLDRRLLGELKEDLRKTGDLLYIVDHRENRREVF